MPPHRVVTHGRNLTPAQLTCKAQAFGCMEALRHAKGDKAKAAAHGLVCTNTPGALDDSVAEFAMGLILSAARHIAATAAQQQEQQI